MEYNEVNIPWLNSFSNNYLRLTIFVTEQCNFRCIYCYEDFKFGKIEDNVIEGIKNLILKRIDELRYLKLSFFGGEPLLNKNAVLEISSWARDICRQNNIEYIGDITTNGYSLNIESFDSLFNSGIKTYQITIDGEKEVHNKLRPTLNGKPTYEKIIENISKMANSQWDFLCTIRLNVADYNFTSVKNFIFENYKIFQNDKRFTFHLHPIFGIPELTLSDKSNLEDFILFINSLGLSYHDGEKEKEQMVCYAARADSYVIRANGIIQKCTVALNSDINKIGKLNSDGTMELDQYKLKKWVFAENKTCPVLSLQLEKLLIPYENAGMFVQTDDTVAEQ